jgi:hypothetical protein
MQHILFYMHNLLAVRRQEVVIVLYSNHCIKKELLKTQNFLFFTIFITLFCKGSQGKTGGKPHIHPSTASRSTGCSLPVVDFNCLLQRNFSFRLFSKPLCFSLLAFATKNLRSLFRPRFVRYKTLVQMLRLIHSDLFL